MDILEDIRHLKREDTSAGKLIVLSQCTRRVCFKEAIGADILPPIVSGRLTSSRFALTYGTVYIRAKMPKGDWIYPELLLEPLSNKYGTINYASGVIKIAMARGNMEPSETQYGNKVLTSGPIINTNWRNFLEYYQNVKKDGFWSEDFHEYSVEWNPDQIVFSVDGVEYGWYEPGLSGYRSLSSSSDSIWYHSFESDHTMAPFDEFFYLTLGVAVGGIMEFPDGMTSANGIQKPWLNKKSNATLSFWQNRDTWYPTWIQPELVVDYVKVVAL